MIAEGPRTVPPPSGWPAPRRDPAICEEVGARPLEGKRRRPALGALSLARRARRAADPELRKIGGSPWGSSPPERARRPTDFHRDPSARTATAASSARGNEDKTPPEILAGRGDSPPNGPAGASASSRTSSRTAHRGRPRATGEGLFDRMNRRGRARGGDRGRRTTTARSPTMSVDEVADVLVAFRDRLSDLKKGSALRRTSSSSKPGRGRRARSLEHPHSAAIATADHPDHGQRRARSSARY